MDQCLRLILEDHEKSVLARLGEAREAVTSLERELADVRKAKSAIADPPREELGEPQPVPGTKHHFVPIIPLMTDEEVAEKLRSPYWRLTMKDLVIKALTEVFPQGATAGDLLDFFANAWGRNDIQRTSLSPQLSRLKQEGKIRLDGLVWSLADNKAASSSEHDHQEPLLIGCGGLKPDAVYEVTTSGIRRIDEPPAA